MNIKKSSYITMIGIIIFLVLMIVFFISNMFIDKYREDLNKKLNETYVKGVNYGIEQWNSVVISKVNKDNKIPYWFNETYYELKISQLCGGKFKK